MNPPYLIMDSQIESIPMTPSFFYAYRVFSHPFQIALAEGGLVELFEHMFEIMVQLLEPPAVHSQNVRVIPLGGEVILDVFASATNYCLCFHNQEMPISIVQKLATNAMQKAEEMAQKAGQLFPKASEALNGPGDHQFAPPFA
ncbi:MAG: hypothetical protein ACFFGZ_15695 [Candidatus Thorarchaeota archaeon]